MSDDGPWAKLRKEVSAQRIVIAALEERHARLQNENARLMEQLHTNGLRAALPVDPSGRLVPNYGGADPLASRMVPTDEATDAARLDWMEANPHVVYPYFADRWAADIPHGDLYKFATLREAIDCARLATPPDEGPK